MGIYMPLSKDLIDKMYDRFWRVPFEAITAGCHDFGLLLVLDKKRVTKIHGDFIHYYEEHIYIWTDQEADTIVSYGTFDPAEDSFCDDLEHIHWDEVCVKLETSRSIIDNIYGL